MHVVRVNPFPLYAALLTKPTIIVSRLADHVLTIKLVSQAAGDGWL